MKAASINYNGHAYTIKDDEWLVKQRKAGTVAYEVMSILVNATQEGKTTKDLDVICENAIMDHEGCKPTFKGYKGFPASTCISINKEIVHGIPSPDRVIQSGDVVKLDLGVTYCGAIADMARTVIVGQGKPEYNILLSACTKAFIAAVKSLKFTRGHRNRLGDIGYAIKREAARINASVIDEMGGHGLDWEMPHASPFVYNIGEQGRGPVIYPGTTIAIEPMFILGPSNAIHVEADGWTVTTKEVGVHYEDTVFVHKDRVEVITQPFLVIES